MSLTIEQPERVPLAADEDGAIRVAGTRVTLDTVVESFRQGATAEEIVQQYPSLSLPDVYSVIGYFLRHESEVNEYLITRCNDAEQLREEHERRFNPMGVRDRLLARRPDLGRK